MKNCFVIQPFDKGPFDKRFDDIIEPAIKNANLHAYRVDKDPGVIIPIDDIEKGIIDSVAVIADITVDNPNIWYEVGFARAADKPLVMICSKQRQKFPFDIQHRSIIEYSTDSISDFENLEHEITDRLIAVVKRQQGIIDDKIRKSRLLEMASNVLRTPGYDISVLEEILQDIRDTGTINCKKVGSHRNITDTTIENVFDKSIDLALIIKKYGKYILSEHGKEMLNFLSSYLRPVNLHY
jgi:hypothetical protein